VHGRELAPAVAGLLAQGSWAAAELELIVIGLGPGSYTGMRIGLAFVKGFALAADCPIVGISSLEVLAHNAPAEAGEVLVVRDAKWGEVYWARFRREAGALVRATPDAIGPVADLDPGGAAVVGDPSAADAGTLGVPALAGPAHPGRHPVARPAATIGCAQYRAHGASAAATLVPHYLRATEAERALEQRTGR
jgi:tRNA threonylcarbamoyladenosine biosynthesis protein TsaB